MISRPLLVLSITTAISEASESNDGSSGGADQTNACSEVPPEISSVQTTLETRYNFFDMGEASVDILMFENFLSHSYLLS